jgi:hypothetical protein
VGVWSLLVGIILSEGRKRSEFVMTALTIEDEIRSRLHDMAAAVDIW